MDSVTSLYNRVEEQAHALVQRSNMALEHLEYLLQLREMEGHFLQVLCDVSLPQRLRLAACSQRKLSLATTAMDPGGAVRPLHSLTVTVS